jgi:deoxyxylulose-5-phosphate synthase
MTVLSRITSPADLKELSVETLRALLQEIRTFLIDKVSGVTAQLFGLRRRQQHQHSR